MNSPRAVLLVVLTLSGFALAVPTAGAPTQNTQADDITAASFQANQQADDNSTLGAEISSFMQVSTTQAQGTVDTGMWVARFNQTKNKSAQKALVSNHVGDMKNQLASLRDRKQKLVEARNDGQISQLKYQSEMSQLIGEIRAVQHSINATRPRAVTVGARVRDVNELDKQANTVGGPEIAAVAKSMHSVNLRAENANNSTSAPGVGNGTGNASGEHPGAGIGGNGTIGIGNGDGNSTVGIGVGNGDGNGGNGSVGIGNGNGHGSGNGN
ncbi:hypothetical protein [Haladaptatus sp. T7]|uniref:hypothetical protein n=1 Tax=Haladaptatus sp. T7 TaxID=2029368 RepID=UPI0021A25166|nr:hypothetical protein [Haladaptatus sp. T7]GKZ13090.1 hypothetical protein HAL_09710 [Haladaptatus sp. T7]